MLENSTMCAHIYKICNLFDFFPQLLLEAYLICTLALGLIDQDPLFPILSLNPDVQIGSCLVCTPHTAGSNLIAQNYSRSVKPFKNLLSLTRKAL